MKKNFILSLAVVFITLFYSISNATYLQLRSPMDVDDVVVNFTLMGIPLSSTTVDLEENKFSHVDIPWWATDASINRSIVKAFNIILQQCGAKLASSLKNTNDYFTMQTFDSFLQNTGQNEIIFPIIGSSTDEIYYGIDLQAYYDGGGTSYNLGDSFNIINGINPDLPGYIVSTSEIYWDLTVGWTTTDPYTGSSIVFSDGGVCVPEPSTYLLFTFGLLVIVTAQASRRAHL